MGDDAQTGRRAPEWDGGDIARAALAHWGAWLRSGGAMGQGYAHETAEGRLRREGAIIRGPAGSRPLDDDELAEKVDRIVARLAHDNRRWPLMLRAYFGGGEDASYQRVADLLADRYGGRVSVGSVRGWMREATATVRGALRETLGI